MDDLDRWTRVLPLGTGAFGQVHLAWDTVDRRWVALKRFTGQDELGLLRFVIESRIRVEHPHLVRTLAFRLFDDRAWLVTQLARGGSVRRLMDRAGPLPWGWVVEAVDQVLDALVALHATGVVHRDLKPANLLLRDAGAVRPHLLVGDFGIATWRTVSMTGVGAAIGTPGYLAPEYLDGQQPSPRTDLFAVGVLAAELLAGRRLVHVSNASQDIPADWTAAVPLPPVVPQRVAAVLERMADPSPSRRYADCAQAREALLAAAPVGARGELSAVDMPDLLSGLPPGWTAEGPVPPDPATALITPDVTTALVDPAAELPPATSAGLGTAPPAATSADPAAAPPAATSAGPATAPPAATSADPATTLPAATSADPATTLPAATLSASGTAPPAATPPGPAAGLPTPAATPANPAAASPARATAPPAAGTNHAAPSDSAGTPGGLRPPASNLPAGTDNSGAPGTPQPDLSPSPEVVHSQDRHHPLLSAPAGTLDTGGRRPKRPAGPKSKRPTARKSTKDRRRAALLLVALLLLGGAATLWWAAANRHVAGSALPAGAPARDPGESPTRWTPVPVEPCSKAELGRERDGADGTERCQRSPGADGGQHWVKEPPGGFPKSDPAGPFPGESCTAEDDTGYTPVGDRIACTGGAWRVVT